MMIGLKTETGGKRSKKINGDFNVFGTWSKSRYPPSPKK